MSYPQPDADLSLLKGLSFFRLNTQLTSPGDIYESPQSARAFAVGPDSDISKIGVVYYDPTQTTQMNKFRLGPERAMSSLFSAQNVEPYMPVYNPANPENSHPGKILIYSDDAYDPTYRPQFSDPADTVIITPPRLDVFSFFAPPAPSVQSSRVDKVFDFPTVPRVNGTNTWLVIPFYGRKWGQVTAIGETGDPTTIAVLGISYMLSALGPGFATGRAFETELFPATSIDEVNATNVIVTAGNQGCFDALVIYVEGDTEVGIPRLRVTMSDTPAATPGT